ncbi:MAG: hypothetical protein WA843_03925, partial [Candidatus Saccharimonadales bacterium]
CLKNKKYAHAPRPLYISDDGQTLLITRVRGIEVNKLHNLSLADKKTITINITDALMALEVIQPRDLERTLKPFGLEMPPVSNEELGWDKYVINTFYPYKDSAPKDAHTEWLHDQIINFKSPQPKPEKLYFEHGDPNGANTLVDKDFNVTFIDWALAKFYKQDKDRQDFELSYAMNHIPLMNERRNDVLEYVAKTKKLNLEILKSNIFRRRQSIKLADMAWPFMMYTKAIQGKAPDKPEVYKKLLDRRIKEYKKEFA